MFGGLNDPRKEALIYLDKRLTYTDLESRVKDVVILIKDKIKKGDVIIQVVPKGIDMIVGILAIFYCGGVYCPFHPKDPLNRLEQIIEQTSCKLILTDSNEKRRLHIGIDTVCLDQINSTSETSILETIIQSDDLVYLISTSGSTGLPKLVSIQWGSVLNLKEGMISRIGWSDRERVFQLARCSFDAQVSEIYVTLLLGGTIIMPHEFWNFSLKETLNYMSEESVSSIFMVPSLVPSLLKSFSEPNANVRSVIIGGEPVYQDAIEGLYQLFPKASVYVAYGPTETCVFASFYSIKEYSFDDRWCPIGTPLPGYEFDILDEENSTGELWISGKGVMKEYYNNLTKSNEVLIRYKEQYGYRTGDIVRRDKNGIYHFVGRVDFQVKFNGQRLELGEIESVLKSVSGVEQVVVVKRLVNDKECLVAYIQTQDSCTDLSKYRKACQHTLPTYMVPLYYQIEKQLPLTSSGKIDRKQLPEITNKSQ